MSEPDVSAYPEEVAYGAENLRVPPHSIQGEQSLLGSLMLDNETWDKIADKVAAGDFYRREHRLIFEAISHLVEADQPFDVVTLAETLERTGNLEDTGRRAKHRGACVWCTQATLGDGASPLRGNEPKSNTV